jgi:hypothetical protein
MYRFARWSSIVVLAFLFPSIAGAQLLTANVLKRVKRIEVGASTATAFTMEVDGRQYLVTAKHVVATLDGPEATIKLCENRNPCVVVPVTILRCNDPIDIAVLIPKEQLTPAFPLKPETTGMIFGQDMFFVGYPLIGKTLGTDIGEQAVGVIRKATLAAQENKDGARKFLLDGRNNAGFSGGPVVYKDLMTSENTYKIAAVVSGFLPEYVEVVEPIIIDPAQITAEDKALNRIVTGTDGTTRRLIGTGKFVQQNTDVVVAYAIEHAIDLIKSSSVKGPQITGAQ